MKLSKSGKEHIIVAIANEVVGEEVIQAIEDSSGAGAVTSVNTRVGDVVLTKSDVGLNNVPNVNATNPANISQTSSYRFVTDTEKSTWNGKQDALGFTAEDSANKATDLTSPDNIKYPTTQAMVTALSGKANSSHTHALSDLTQSGATTGQVVTWSGSAWAAATPAGGSSVWGGITGDLIDQTDLQSALDAKVSKAGDTVTGTLTFEDPLIAERSITLDSINGMHYHDNASSPLNYSLDMDLTAAGLRVTQNATTGTVVNTTFETGTYHIDVTDASGAFSESQFSINSYMEHTPASSVVTNTIAMDPISGTIKITSYDDDTSITAPILPVSPEDVAVKQYVDDGLAVKFDDPAGTVSQYIRGDGSLANFPSTGGGGSSVSYYLNGGTASDIATYYQMSKIAVVGTNADFTASTGSTVLIAKFMTDAGDPSLLNIPAGNWNLELYFSASSNGGSPSFYVELYKYNGVSSTLIASNSATPEQITGGTSIDLYFTALAIPSTTLASTDRLEIRVYVTRSGRNITLHTQDSHLCQIITNFSSGLLSLNGLVSQNQFFATGTTGTDFNISSSGSTHTFNIPVSSATNTGLLSSTNWTTFNNKLSKGVKTIFCIDNGDYATGQAAVDAASQGDTILFGAKSGGWGDIVIPSGKGISILGLQADDSKYVRTGSITFSPTSGTIGVNEVYISNLYITSATQAAVLFGGSVAARLRVYNCYIAPTSNQRAVSLTNTVTTSPSVYSSAYFNSCVIDAGISTSSVFESNTPYVRITHSTIDGGSMSLQLNAGTLESDNNTYSLDRVGEIINIAGGTLLCTRSSIANATTNGSGVLLAAGAVFGNVSNVFSVATGTGYCIRGIGGVHAYAYITFANSALLAFNVKVQSTLTNVPYTVAFTLAP